MPAKIDTMLSKNFHSAEFACRCGCGGNTISQELVDMLQGIRDRLGRIDITSGYRCKAHNKAVGGVKESAHTKGLAVDIACTVGADRYALLDTIFVAGFYRIGIAKSFIHVDIDDSKPGSVWVY